jgi:hypothetical protein
VETAILRIEQQTFADDSFRIANSQAPYGEAQLADSVDVDWTADIVLRVGCAEVKWQIVRQHREAFPPDLRRDALRAVRESLIIVVDGAIYREERDSAAAIALQRPGHEWPEAFCQTWDSSAPGTSLEKFLPTGLF